MHKISSYPRTHRHRPNLPGTLRRVALFSLAMAAAPLAHADLLYGAIDSADFSAADGRTYGSVGVGMLRFKAPQRDNVGAIYEDIGDIVTANNIHSFQPTDTTPVFGLLLGRHIAPNTDWWFGSNVRLEAAVQYYNVEDARQVERQNSASTAFLSIDGTGYIYNAPSGALVRGEFEAEYSYLDFDLRLRSDFVRANPKLTLTTSVGLAHVSLEEQHRIRYRDVTFLEDFNHISEQVDTRYLGPVVGLAVNYRSSPKLSLHGGISLHLAHVEAKYQATQIYVAVPGSASASDSYSTWSHRTSLTLGASYDLGWSTIGLVGGLDYWGDAPVIQHPVAPLGENFNVPSTEPASLSSASMTHYFLGLRMSSAF